MDKPVFYIVFLLTFMSFSIFSINGQNLVPNPSFEDITQCPDFHGQIHFAKPWFQPSYNALDTNDLIAMSSSDLFHECALPSVYFCGVPSNWMGYQYPRTGKAYAGIVFWGINGGGEKIETPLTEPLEKDSSYCVAMYVVNAPFEHHTTGTSNLHFLFTEDSLTFLGYQYTAVPSVANPDTNIVTDTLNWTLISGIYKAKGGEQFLTIGNFYDDTTYTISDPNGWLSYYYIDDVWVSKLGSKNSPCAMNDDSEEEDGSGNEEEEEEEEDDDSNDGEGEQIEIYKFPNVFTPNGDGINDYWEVGKLKSEDYVLILNRWGNEVARLKKSKPYWDGNCIGKPCSNGVYFYKAFLNGEIKHGFIHLIMIK